MEDLPIILGMCGLSIGIYLGIISLELRFHKSKNNLASSIQNTNLQPSTDLPLHYVPPFWITCKKIGDITNQIVDLILLLAYNIGIIWIVVLGFQSFHYYSSLEWLILGFIGLVIEGLYVFMKYYKQNWHNSFYKILEILIGCGWLFGSISFLYIGIEYYEPSLVVIGLFGLILEMLLYLSKNNKFIKQSSSGIKDYSDLDQFRNDIRSENSSVITTKGFHDAQELSVDKSTGMREIEYLMEKTFPSKNPKEITEIKPKKMKLVWKIPLIIYNALAIIAIPLYGFGIGFLLIEWFIIRKNKRLRMKYHKYRARRLLKGNLKIAILADKLEQASLFNKARGKWTKARKLYEKSLRFNPEFFQQAYVSQIIMLIKKKMGYNFLLEGIFLSSDAWKLFQQKKYAKAIKEFKQANQIVEKTIKYIENQERLDQQFGFTLNISLLYDILKLYQMIIQQIEMEEKYKKQANIYQNNLDLSEIFEKINTALKEINEVLWIYGQSCIMEEKQVSQEKIDDLLDSKLTQSLQTFSNLQDRITYLIQYLQAPENEKKLPNSAYSIMNFDISTQRPSENALNGKIGDNEIGALNTQNDKPMVKIIREYEYMGGKIRFKVGLVNTTGKVLTNLALRFDLPNALKWIIHEPSYTRRGDTILLSKLGGEEKIAISLYLEPINCLESAINATLTYFDSQDRPQAVIMPTKKVSITCPIFFTREDANLARVKSIQQKLKYNDKKIFPMVKSSNMELIFNHILETVGNHDVKLVDREFSSSENAGEAWYYGITKVKKQKMVIRLVMDSIHQILEVHVNGDDPEPITGLLAELEGQIREKLIMRKVITDGSTFHDINMAVLMGNCPYCNGPISPEWIGIYKKGESISCKYCDVAIIPY